MSKKDEVVTIPPSGNFIVGIGASADGIPTLEKLFERMPADTNMTFVIIQHMSPDHASILDQIIQRKTGMKVEKITTGMKIEPNRVYLPPVGHYLNVSGDVFKISKFAPGTNRLHLTIDHFFRSLATNSKEMAVGIVLTGSGSDGSQGIKEIKQNSGWVLVQDPKSAGFDSMPRNAIDTGVVDIVCDIETMSEKLVELPTKGTSMYFTVPYKEGEMPTGEEEEITTMNIPDLTGKKILIVEDDAYSLEMIKYLVQKTHAELFVAEDGKIATELFKKNYLDFVLLDIRLPKKNGYEVLKTIRKTHPDLPVIAETAHALREEVLSFSNLGFTDYLLKPIDQAELYHILSKYLLPKTE